MSLTLVELIETDQRLDALGKHFTREVERDLKKPRLIQYSKDQVKSYDLCGEVIEELSGPYTDDLRARIEAARDERTEFQDIE